MKKPLPVVSLMLLALMLIAQGCVSQPPSRYEQRHDAAPMGVHELSKIPDAVPKAEPLSRGGNQSPYRVRGKTYHLLPTSLGYVSAGKASWYGSKFHGHQTSNGEIYNMFGMSAAHRSLPIPTYVQVTNLSNGRQVVVRVNDRGPFHSERIIDLSYAAAAKLGFVDQGTAEVKIEAIDPIAWRLKQSHKKPQRSSHPPSPSVALDSAIYLQVGAFQNKVSAQKLQQQLKTLTVEEVSIFFDVAMTPKLHKVQIGPFSNRRAADALKTRINSKGWGRAILVERPNS